MPGRRSGDSIGGPFVGPVLALWHRTPSSRAAIPIRRWRITSDPDSALAYYERYAEFPLRSLTWDHLDLPAAYRRLGELHEARDNTEKAVEYYNRFVELWENADSERNRLWRTCGGGLRG